MQRRLERVPPTHTGFYRPHYSSVRSRPWDSGRYNETSHRKERHHSPSPIRRRRSRSRSTSSPRGRRAHLSSSAHSSARGSKTGQGRTHGSPSCSTVTHSRPLHAKEECSPHLHRAVSTSSGRARSGSRVCVSSGRSLTSRPSDVEPDDPLTMPELQPRTEERSSPAIELPPNPLECTHVHPAAGHSHQPVDGTSTDVFITDSKRPVRFLIVISQLQRQPIRRRYQHLQSTLRRPSQFLFRLQRHL